ncbi:hypothetical protein [Nonomuraea sp. NPDC048916]|uniref:hypothetical protein n=1 Tax=Nonomuraea sp. NPDC048916 TaxID=3154232 RepID=UPI0033FC43C4
MTASTVTTSRSTFLRLALALDAVVTGVNGLGYLAGADLLTDLLGPGTAPLRGIGAFLVVYSLAVGLLARRKSVNPAATMTVIALNIAWALGSVLAVVTGLIGFTTVGALWAVAQALVVGLFAALQIIGLRRLR